MSVNTVIILPVLSKGGTEAERLSATDGVYGTYLAIPCGQMPKL